MLKDGASSTYGADAVAGVVNIITKKQITGISGMAEGGITQRGDGGNQRVSLTAGFGDLASQGFNVYISGHYINQRSALQPRPRLSVQHRQSDRHRHDAATAAVAA